MEDLLDSLPDWINEGLLIGISIGLLASFVFWWFDSPTMTYRRYIDSKSPDDREWVIGALGGRPLIDTYRAWIAAFDHWLESWFGPHLSQQALHRCFLLSIVCPVILFMLTWLVSGQAPIDSVPGFDETSGFIDRLWRVLAIGGGGFVVCFLAFRLDFIEADVIQGLNRLFGNQNSATPLIVRIVGVVAGALALVGPFALAIVYFDAFMSRFLGVVAFATAVFYFIVPAFNAGLDWISWAVTRFFFNEKSGFPGPSPLYLELFLDFVAAVTFLVLLALLLPAGIELLNLVLIRLGTGAVQWTGNLETAIRDPWGAGLFVIGMLVTTLALTILHVVIGLAGIFSSLHHDTRALAQRIPPINEEKEALGEDLRDEIVRALRRVRFWHVPAGIVVGMLISGFLHLFGGLAPEPFGEVLIDAAYCGGALVNADQALNCPWW